MLTALHKNQLITIFSFDLETMKHLSEKKELLCPDCQDVLLFKQCNRKQSHFSHVKKDCSFPFSEPESIEHETGKQKIFEWLQQNFKQEECHLEQFISLTKQRADTFVSSHSLAVEFQCSPIQEKTWSKRHDLYKQASIWDIWILGYSMHKYYKETSCYEHKLNPLEETILKHQHKIIYFDVLTNQFVFLFVEKKHKNYWTGKEYFFKAEELLFHDKYGIVSKFDFFIHNQKKRKQFSENERDKAKETSQLIKETKKTLNAPKVLATKKQINYIKHLLYQNNKKIPYKLHGLLKEEATVLIKKLANET